MGLNRPPALCCVFAFLLLITSCSTGPAPPAPGTPQFYWSAAQENYRTADYIKTSDQLEQLAKSENEFTARARPWRVMILSGLAQGYAELADSFDQGARASRTSPTPFRRYVSDYRSMAGRLALAFAEAFEKLEKSQTEDKVTLAFALPLGSPTPGATLERVAKGQLPPKAEIEGAQIDAVRRAVLLAACRAAGAPNDTAKTSEILKTQPATVGRDVFFKGMAEVLYDLSGLFARLKLDQPERQTYFLEHAMEALKPVPESKETKELKKKIESGMKAAKAKRT